MGIHISHTQIWYDQTEVLCCQDCGRPTDDWIVVDGCNRK